MAGADCNPLTVEVFGDTFVRMSVYGEGEDAGLIGRSADESQTGNPTEKVRGVFQKRVLVCGDRRDADFKDVVDRCSDPDRASDVRSPRLEFFRRVLEDSFFKPDILDHMSTTLPWREQFEKMSLAIEGSDACWSKYLMSREHEKIGIERLNIDGDVRSGLCAIDEDMDPEGMGQLNDLLDRVDRP